MILTSVLILDCNFFFSCSGFVIKTKNKNSYYYSNLNNNLWLVFTRIYSSFGLSFFTGAVGFTALLSPPPTPCRILACWRNCALFKLVINWLDWYNQLAWKLLIMMTLKLSMTSSFFLYVNSQLFLILKKLSTKINQIKIWYLDMKFYNKS